MTMLRIDTVTATMAATDSTLRESALAARRVVAACACMTVRIIGTARAVVQCKPERLRRFTIGRLLQFLLMAGICSDAAPMLGTFTLVRLLSTSAPRQRHQELRQ